MARYIDADRLRDKVKTETNPYGKPTLEYASGLKVLVMIDKQPTADVVEVVRCKDCEHYSLAMLKCSLPSDDEHSFDNYAPHIWQPNDFCSYGTPKERGGEK